MRHASRGPVPPVRPGKNTRTALAPAEEQNCRFATWGDPRVFFQKPGIQATGRSEVLSRAIPSGRILRTTAWGLSRRLQNAELHPGKADAPRRSEFPPILCALLVF